MIENKAKSLSILYLIECAGRGGAESVVLTLATPRARHARVASLRTGWLRDSIVEAGIPFDIISYSPRSDLLLAYRIARLIDKTKPDVVHCHCFTMNIAGALGSALAGVPSIGTLHGAIYDLDSRARRMAYRVAGMMHSKVVAVSNYLRKELNELAHIPLQKIDVIHNGVPAREPDTSAAVNTRRKIGLGESDLVVGSVGMFRPEKGHTDLIDAVALARKHAPELKLVLVGDGTCKQDLHKRAAEHNLRGAVHFASSGSNIAAMLSAMDIFALPSHTEGLSIATIEAMACGTPVIVTDCGGPVEIVTDGITGLVVPPCDPPAMADALVRLVRDASLRKCLSANARACARDSFSLDRMLERYEELYQEVAR